MKVFDILDRIEKYGYEAYVIGGYVRDYLLGIDSSDIDICTNARVKDLLDIFNDMNVTSNEYGSVKIITDTLRVDITTYRRDVRYNGSRRKVEIEYVDNLLDDVNRRDFTMNTICMSKNGTILDILGGRKDIEDRVVRCVGKAKERLIEDPLRMLRAVRFATVLNFRIDDELYNELVCNRELIKELSLERIKDELKKILLSTNFLNGLSLLKSLGYLDILGISYNDDIVYVPDICGMYSQLSFRDEFPFSKEEKNSIKGIQKIVKYGTIDNIILYEYGLYLCIVAGNILDIDKEVITKMDKKLPIHSKHDINIDSDKICSILGIEPCRIISTVYNKLEQMILKGILKNDSSSLENYLVNNREMWLDERDGK